MRTASQGQPDSAKPASSSACRARNDCRYETMANTCRKSALVCAAVLAGVLSSASVRSAASELRKESRPVQPITQLVVRGAIDVWVRPGPLALQVIAENPRDVLTEWRGGVLTITHQPVGGNAGDGCLRIGDVGIRWREGVSICSPPEKVAVELTVQQLAAVRLEGAGDLRLDDVRQDALGLAVTGAASVRVSGAVKHLSVAISGACDVRARDLRADSAELQVTGSGSIEVHVTQSLSAHIAGAGDIAVWGNPARRATRVLGAGSVRFR